ncbi:unnamed protein product [Moneuplotes crassus]|uniref:C2H2-type domain-containing protein n=1 Tax=Euplotes crassus TaxID=5936 RepID=A0AAD1Y3S0_EUPCR|nr:unnamed protein product [Moneuplotes crassus]
MSEGLPYYNSSFQEINMPIISNLQVDNVLKKSDFSELRAGDIAFLKLDNTGILVPAIIEEVGVIDESDFCSINTVCQNFHDNNSSTAFDQYYHKACDKSQARSLPSPRPSGNVFSSTKLQPDPRCLFGMNFFNRENSGQSDITEMAPLQTKGVSKAYKESISESSKEIEEPGKSAEPILDRAEEKECLQRPCKRTKIVFSQELLQYEGYYHQVSKGRKKRGVKRSMRYFCKYEKCRKGFYRAQNLVMHLRVHFKIKKYQCEYCEEKFIQRGNLDKHIKRHCAIKNKIDQEGIIGG